MKKFILLSVLCVVLSSSYSYGMEQELVSFDTPIEEFKENKVDKLRDIALFFVYEIDCNGFIKFAHGREDFTSNVRDYINAGKFLQYSSSLLTNFDHSRYITCLEGQAESKEDKQGKVSSLIVFFDENAEHLKTFSYGFVMNARSYFNNFIARKLVVKKIESRKGERLGGILFGGKEGNKIIARYGNTTGGRSSYSQETMTMEELIKRHQLKKHFDLSKLENKK